MANCVVCGKPVINPVYTTDGSMRHERCRNLPVREAKDLMRMRRRSIRKARGPD